MGFWMTFALFIISTVVSALLAPNPKNAEASAAGEWQVPTAEEGRSFPLVIGTCKLKSPNVVWWGDVKVVPIKKTSNWLTGHKATIGHRYHLGMQLGLSLPVDSLIDLYIGEKSLTEAGISIASAFSESGITIDIDLPDLFGGEGREGGVVGKVSFYFGSLTQEPNLYLMGQWGTTPSAYRGLCYAVAECIYFGTQPYLKDWAFVLRKLPCPNGLTSDKANIGGDANPAYAIAFLLTAGREEGGLGESITDLDLASFQAAGTTLYNENFGISLLLDNSQSADAWIGEILRHIDGVLFTDPASGLWTIKLTRNDYNPNDLVLIDESSVLEPPEVTWADLPDTINRVTIRYLDRAADFTVKTAQDNNGANIWARGGISVGTSLDFLGLSNATIAQYVAARETQLLATQLAKGSVTTNRIAWKLRPGSPFKLSYASQNIGEMICRVSTIRYGQLGSSQITIDFVQDVFSVIAQAIPPPPTSAWVDPIPSIQPCPEQMIIEAPYGLVGERRNVLGFGSRADSTVTEIATYANEGSGYNEEDAIVYSATGVLSSLWSAKTPYVDTWGFFVDLTNGRDLDLLPGRTVQVANLNKGYNIALVGNEWVSWGSAVISGGLLQVSNVMRGLFDSSPEDHLPGERVWFPLGSNIIRQDLDVLQGGTGTPGQAGTDGQSIIWRGVYSDSTPYFAYDVVRYNGAVYIATADNTGTYPDLNPDYWDLMTEDGADGVDGESSFVATSVQVVTASLAPNSTETASIAIRKTANILKIVTDYPCWVRLYGSSAERSADSSRPITEDSLPGKGCFFDGSSSPSELEISSEPVPVFVNHDSPRVDFGYISIKNLDSTNRVITVTVHYVPLEA